MSAASSRAGKRSEQQRAAASSSAEGVSSNVCAKGQGVAVEVTGERPVVGDVQAALADGMTNESSHSAAPDPDRHKFNLPQHGPRVLLAAACFSVQELKERAIRMFIAALGDAPRSARCGTNMCMVTAELIINVTAAIEALMGTPKKHGSHRIEMIRCCGELDKEEARGWLVADAVGRPLLHRNDDRSQNDARDVGKRVLERAGKAERAIAAAKEKAAASVRAAKRAAAKDEAVRSGVAQAEAEAVAAIAAARSATVDLDIPHATVGVERPESYWRMRELQEAEAAATAAAAEAAMAAAAKQGTEAALCRTVQAMEKPDAPERATHQWLEASGAHRATTAAAREATKESDSAAAKVVAAKAAAVAAGVDFRSAKRKREDEAAVEAAACAEIAGVVTDLITAVAAHELAEPFWISLSVWYDMERGVFDAERHWRAANLLPPHGRAAELRAAFQATCAVEAEQAEMRIRQVSWDGEQRAEPAVLALVRRLEADQEPWDYPPEPTDEEVEAAGEEGAGALWDAWVARCDAVHAAIDPILMEAREVVRERKLARQPWEAALTARMRDLEGRQTGDYRRGWPRFHAPWGGRTRSGMQHPWAQV